jgi:hypothetical protein
VIGLVIQEVDVDSVTIVLSHDRGDGRKSLRDLAP